MPAVASLRKRRSANNPEVVGFIAYDCPCSSALKRCDENHCSSWLADNYVDVDTKTWAAKPAITVQIDGSDTPPDTVVSKTPITTVAFKVVGSGVPDGATVTVNTKGPVDITDGPDEFELTFTDGQTDTVSLIVPGHGIKGRIVLHGKYSRPTLVYLRGWGA